MYFRNLNGLMNRKAETAGKVQCMKYPELENQRRKKQVHKNT